MSAMNISQTATGKEVMSSSSAKTRTARRFRPSLSRVLLALAPVLLAVSVIFPFWSLTLHAPQYPGGLDITVYTHQVIGDVSEVDGLNHYIGMMPLGDAASFERAIASYAIAAFILLGLAAAFLRKKWTALLALPIIAFPFAFAIDLYIWLYRAGHGLDPRAPLSSSVKPFTPAILGEGIVGQFSTTAFFGSGFFIALAAALLALTGMILRLRHKDAGSAK